jgi:NAD(P)-dependent dehydrogenase (short-subunit alcohol dehydrogenase family)
VPHEPLKDKVVIVTGAASGIGRRISEDFARAGAKVAVVDRNGPGVEELCSRLDAEACLPVAEDVLADAAAERMVGAAVDAFGDLDVLVNCAGIFPTAPALEISAKEWDRVLETNLRAPFLCSQAAARRMVDTGKPGSIVNITSSAAVVARPGVAHYCASKAALVMLTKVLAIEWAQHGIRVNAVAPGLVETPGVGALTATEEGRVEHRRKIARIPLARIGEPGEISEAVLFLASGSSSFITGETLFVDGGYSAGRTFAD